MKRLNLSTAFLQMYTVLNEQDANGTDYAVMSNLLYQFNGVAWQKDVTTSISYITWTLNSTTRYVRKSLRKLEQLQLIAVKLASNTENSSQKATAKSKICIALGEKFNDYAPLQSNQSINNNNKQTTLKLVSK